MPLHMATSTLRKEMLEFSLMVLDTPNPHRLQMSKQCKQMSNQATGSTSQHYSVPVPSLDKLGGLRQKWGNEGSGGTDSPNWAASR